MLDDIIRRCKIEGSVSEEKKSYYFERFVEERRIVINDMPSTIQRYFSENTDKMKNCLNSVILYIEGNNYQGIQFIQYL